VVPNAIRPRPSPRSPFLHPDASTGDGSRLNAYVVRLRAGSPRLQRSPTESFSFGGIGDLDRVSTNDDAPAGAIAFVHPVDFESHGGSPDGCDEFAARVGSKHDRVLVEHIVDGRINGTTPTLSRKASRPRWFRRSSSRHSRRVNVS
jgi:hypothetical protein